MTKKVLLVAALLVFLLHPVISSLQDRTVEAKIKERLLGLQEGTCEDRSKSFYALMQLGRSDIPSTAQGYWITITTSGLFKVAPSMTEEIKLALIHALENENLRHESARRRHAVGIFSEECTNFYGDLIGAVASLKDERSVNAALGAITTGSMATGILLEFPEDALDPVLEKQKLNDPLVRASAVFVLSEMVENARTNKSAKALDESSIEKIRKGLLQGAHDEKFYVRRSAVDGLGALGDPESVRELERLVSSDPYKDYSKDEKRVRYPVREAAQKSLIKLGKWRGK